jgi:site-specific DNA-methyltransferase (adenine-specific)
MNPPYGRAIKDWIKKAYEEGQKNDTTVVALIPARTDTRYWHDYVMKSDAVYFIRGRLKFGNGENSAPFPSAVVVFRSTNHNFPKIGVMEAR